MVHQLVYCTQLHFGELNFRSLNPLPESGEVVVGLTNQKDCTNIFEVERLKALKESPSEVIIFPILGSVSFLYNDKAILNQEDLLFSTDYCRYPTRKEFAWYRHNKGV